MVHVHICLACMQLNSACITACSQLHDDTTTNVNDLVVDCPLEQVQIAAVAAVGRRQLLLQSRRHLGRMNDKLAEEPPAIAAQKAALP